MHKKNYLTQEEQEIWEYIKDKEIVDNELVKQIFPDLSENKRNKVLHNIYRKGFLKRARKDLYYNPKELKSFYKLALKIKEGYVGLSSALRYYNLLEYEDFTMFIMTKDFQKKINLIGTQYVVQFIPLKSLFIGFNKKDDIYIPSIEKTLFDCFLKPKFVGFTNITKALYDARIDWNKFIAFFKMTKNNSLYQRTGYILELMKKKTKFKVPPFVFEFLFKKVKNPVKLIPIMTKSKFNKKWKIQDNVGEKNILSWWY
ncbi:MAG: hypothetical protein AABX29_07370 [Nanoarchaeota archaeon]